MSACEGERDAVWVPGAAAQEALLFSRCMLDREEKVRGEGGEAAPGVFDRSLEDANAVQVALIQVLELLGSGQMDMKMAGLMLYGLQTASANLKNTKFEAEKVTDVVIDRNTVDQTCINGPQWFAKDFAEQEEPEPLEEDELDQLEEKGEEVVAEPFQTPLAQERVIGEEVSRSSAAFCGEKMGPLGKFRAVKRKRPELRNLDDEPDSLAKILLQRLGLPFISESAASG